MKMLARSKMNNSIQRKRQCLIAVLPTMLSVSEKYTSLTTKLALGRKKNSFQLELFLLFPLETYFKTWNHEADETSHVAMLQGFINIIYIHHTDFEYSVDFK